MGWVIMLQRQTVTVADERPLEGSVTPTWVAGVMLGSGSAFSAWQLSSSLRCKPDRSPKPAGEASCAPLKSDQV